MPFFNDKAPGVYVIEQPGPKTISPVGTSTAAFVGQAPDKDAHRGEAVAVNNWSQFRTEFAPEGSRSTFLSHAVSGFFANRGQRCFIVNVPDSEPIAGGDRPRTGLKLLEELDEVAIVAAPGRFDQASYEALLTHCEANGDRVCICDPPDTNDTESLKVVGTAAVPANGTEKAPKGAADESKSPSVGGGRPGVRPRMSLGGYGAFYFPWIYVMDAMAVGTQPPVAVPPSGHMAGIWAGTDGTRGVHKAPANVPVAGAVNLRYFVTEAEQGDLNVHGVNCIRFFSNGGIKVWGARTLAEESDSQRYINVRRLTIMIKESIKRGNSWAVFEPNDRTLWKTLRSEVTGFLRNVYADGALMGATPEEAFFVKCDEETNPPESIDLGQVVTVIGIAPVKPAEFIIFKIGQNAGGTEASAL